VLALEDVRRLKEVLVVVEPEGAADREPGGDGDADTHGKTDFLDFRVVVLLAVAGRAAEATGGIGVIPVSGEAGLGRDADANRKGGGAYGRGDGAFRGEVEVGGQGAAPAGFRAETAVWAGADEAGIGLGAGEQAESGGVGGHCGKWAERGCDVRSAHGHGPCPGSCAKYSLGCIGREGGKGEGQYQWCKAESHGQIARFSNFWTPRSGKSVRENTDATASRAVRSKPGASVV